MFPLLFPFTVNKKLPKGRKEFVSNKKPNCRCAFFLISVPRAVDIFSPESQLVPLNRDNNRIMNNNNNNKKKALPMSSAAINCFWESGVGEWIRTKLRRFRHQDHFKVFCKKHGTRKKEILRIPKYTCLASLRRESKSFFFLSTKGKVEQNNTVYTVYRVFQRICLRFTK